MAKFDPSIHDEGYFAKRKQPAMVAYISPFRLVNTPDVSPWSISIDEVNRGGWDYAALHEVVGGIDVGLDAPYHLVVARDGAVALPPISKLRGEKHAVEFFNRCFAALLLGGVYCEAIGLDGLDFGSILDWKYLRSTRHGMASANQMHMKFRMGRGAPVDNIALLNPRTVDIGRLAEAVDLGQSILRKIPELNGEFLLKGATGYARRDWSVALANLWIVVEQISSHLWSEHVLSQAQTIPSVPGRSKQLSDFRTWTTGVRLEVLHQIGRLPAESLAFLSEARKARNNLSHQGAHPTASSAKAAWKGVMGLLQVAIPCANIPLLSMDMEDHTLSDPFERKGPERVEPSYWMPIPKLPGEEEFEQLEAQFLANRSGAPRVD